MFYFAKINKNFKNKYTNLYYFSQLTSTPPIASLHWGLLIFNPSDYSIIQLFSYHREAISLFLQPFYGSG